MFVAIGYAAQGLLDRLNDDASGRVCLVRRNADAFGFQLGS
jgi:hypothetical protein